MLLALLRRGGKASKYAIGFATHPNGFTVSFPLLMNACDGRASADRPHRRRSPKRPWSKSLREPETQWTSAPSRACPDPLRKRAPLSWGSHRRCCIRSRWTPKRRWRRTEGPASAARRGGFVRTWCRWSSDRSLSFSAQRGRSQESYTRISRDYMYVCM